MTDEPKKSKPTIEQLAEVFEKEEQQAITILPNGEIVIEGNKNADTGKLKPLTFRENLGGEYAEPEP